MARVILPRGAALELFGGRDQIEVEGKTLWAVIHALEALGPGFADWAGTRLALAVDGMVCDDWSVPVRPDSEILAVVRVAGGSERGAPSMQPRCSGVAVPLQIRR